MALWALLVAPGQARVARTQFPPSPPPFLVCARRVRCGGGCGRSGRARAPRAMSGLVARSLRFLRALNREKGAIKAGTDLVGNEYFYIPKTKVGAREEVRWGGMGRCGCGALDWGWGCRIGPGRSPGPAASCRAANTRCRARGRARPYRRNFSARRGG